MAKKKVSKKVASKVTKTSQAGAEAGPEKPSKENIKFFMNGLILSGHCKKIPEEAKDQVAEAQRLRQFAERLCNQLRKFD